MRFKTVAKTICVATLSALCVFGTAACSTGQSGSDSSDSSTTSGVAATVNGTEISEQVITDYIQTYRENYGYDTEDTWGEYLSTYGYTPESLREQVIDYYVQQELVKEGAAEQGITIEESEVQSYVDTMKANYSDDEAWQEALDSVGMTEDEYKERLEYYLLEEEFSDTFTPEDDPTDEEVLEYAQTYASYYDGAKRSSHILFSSDDEATAQEVLDQLNAGTLDFAEAATQYSTDTGSAEDGGDVGWDVLTSFVDEYQDALDALEKDQTSGLVTSDYGIHIIKCTDVFTAPEELTSIDQLPSEFVETFRSSVKSQEQSTAYSEWLEEAEENADIVINDMPSDVPYNVDMTQYETEDETTDDSTSSTDETTTESTESTESTDTTDTTEGETTTDSSTTDTTTDTTTESTESTEGSSTETTGSTTSAS